MLIGDAADHELSIHFEGTSIGLLVEASAESGNLLWAVDDQPFSLVEVFDEFSAALTRPRPLYLTDQLTPAGHRLRLRIHPDRPAQSKATQCRLGYLLTQRQLPDT
jgi:hypothetical protein